MAPVYDEATLREIDNIENIKDEKYTGKQEDYNLKPIIATHTSLLAAAKDLTAFLKEAKAEMERLMDDVDAARTAMDEHNTTLLELIQVMPDATQRQQKAPGVRAWAKPENK